MLSRDRIPVSVKPVQRKYNLFWSPYRSRIQSVSGADQNGDFEAERFRACNPFQLWKVT